MHLNQGKQTSGRRGLKKRLSYFCYFYYKWMHIYHYYYEFLEVSLIGNVNVF